MSGFFKQKQLNEYEFKTPKKVQQQQQENIQTIEEFGLKDSPLQFQNKSIQTLKNEQKLEEKVNKIIRRIKFDDDQLVIKKDQSIFRQKRTTNKEYKVNSSYTLDLINSIEIRRDNVIVNKLEKVQTSDQQIQQCQIHYLQQQYQNIRNESITCRCKKTKCIKYYCECFQYGQECSFKCECTGCCNKQVKQSSGKMQLVSPTIEFQGCKCQKQKYLYFFIQSLVVQRNTVNVSKEIKDVQIYANAQIIVATSFIKLNLKYQILANYQVNLKIGLDYIKFH